MKITSVEIHPTGSSEICVLSFRDPRRLNSFNVKGIDGLDADEIIPRYYGLSEDSSTKFFNLALEKRDLKIQIELNPDFGLNESYSGLRDVLYRAIASSRTGMVQIQFKNDTDVVAAISGFVSKLEADLFQKTPEVNLTVKCDDPMLRALVPVAIDTESLDPSLTVIQDLISTAPHGFNFEIEFTGAVEGFSIGTTEWSFDVVPVGGFLVGDILKLSSEYNGKYVYVTRGVDDIHLADVITPGSIWPILFPGDNTFVCADPTSLDWVSISHYPTYWGV